MKRYQLLASAIKEQRVNKKHYTQRELADLVDLSISYISKIEGNTLENAPSKERVIALADALDLDRDILLLKARYLPDTWIEPTCDFFLSILNQKVE